MPTCYVVAGPPRSGTSLTAGLLHRLGVSMGSRLLPADTMNPKGFFVDLDFEEILSRIYNAENLPSPGDRLPEEADRLVRSIVREREKAGVDWGVKTLWAGPLIHVLLEECEAVRLVRVNRPLLASRLSLAAHTAHTPEKIAEIITWGKATADYLAGLVPTTDVTFGDLIDNKAVEVGKLASLSGKQLRQEVLDFVDSSLRNF